MTSNLFMTESLNRSKEKVVINISLDSLNNMFYLFLRAPGLCGYSRLNIARLDMIQNNMVISYCRTFGIDSTLQEFLDKITTTKGEGYETKD